METKLEGVSQSLKNVSQIEMDREVSLKDRLEMWDKSLKEMSRGIQVIRDKQELLEAQAELAEMKKADEVKRLLEAKKAEEAKKSQEAKSAESAPKPQPAAPAPQVLLGLFQHEDVQPTCYVDLCKQRPFSKETNLTRCMARSDLRVLLQPNSLHKRPTGRPCLHSRGCMRRLFRKQASFVKSQDRAGACRSDSRLGPTSDSGSQRGLPAVRRGTPPRTANTWPASVSAQRSSRSAATDALPPATPTCPTGANCLDLHDHLIFISCLHA